MAMDLSCTGTSRSGRVVRERRVRHEPASGRRRRRPAPARLAAAKAGQVGICGGCIGWDICSIRRDASMPPFEVSAARSASFVLGVLQCRITCHANGGERFDQDATRAGLQRKGVGSLHFETVTSTASCTAARLTAEPLSVCRGAPPPPARGGAFRCDTVGRRERTMPTEPRSPQPKASMYRAV